MTIWIAQLGQGGTPVRFAAAPARCWADGTPLNGLPNLPECQAVATTELGLCARHYLEMVPQGSISSETAGEAC